MSIDESGPRGGLLLSVMHLVLSPTSVKLAGLSTPGMSVVFKTLDYSVL